MLTFDEYREASSILKKSGSRAAAKLAILGVLARKRLSEVEIAKAAAGTSATTRTAREAAAAKVARQDQEAAEKAKRTAPVIAEIEDLLKSQTPRARELFKAAMSGTGIAAHVARKELARMAPELGAALGDLTKAAGLPSPKMVAAAGTSATTRTAREAAAAKVGQDQKKSPLVKASQARADELTADTAGGASPLVKAAMDRAKQLAGKTAA